MSPFNWEAFGKSINEGAHGLSSYFMDQHKRDIEEARGRRDFDYQSKANAAIAKQAADEASAREVSMMPLRSQETLKLHKAQAEFDAINKRAEGEMDIKRSSALNSPDIIGGIQSGNPLASASSMMKLKVIDDIRAGKPITPEHQKVIDQLDFVAKPQVLALMQQQADHSRNVEAGKMELEQKRQLIGYYGKMSEYQDLQNEVMRNGKELLPSDIARITTELVDNQKLRSTLEADGIYSRVETEIQSRLASAPKDPQTGQVSPATEAQILNDVFSSTQNRGFRTYWEDRVKQLKTLQDLGDLQMYFIRTSKAGQKMLGGGAKVNGVVDQFTADSAGLGESGEPGVDVGTGAPVVETTPKKKSEPGGVARAATNVGNILSKSPPGKMAQGILNQIFHKTSEGSGVPNKRSPVESVALSSEAEEYAKLNPEIPRAEIALMYRNFLRRERGIKK